MDDGRYARRYPAPPVIINPGMPMVVDGHHGHPDMHHGGGFDGGHHGGGHHGGFDGGHHGGGHHGGFDGGHHGGHHH